MTYVAFIRGVGPENPNMHGHKLRDFFEKLGFKNVRTLLSSGNVIFESDPIDNKLLENRIEEKLPEMLGFSKTTIVRSYDQLRDMFDSNPFEGVQDTPTSRLNVTFLKVGKEVFTVIDMINSKTTQIMSGLEKKYGKEITTRTLKTVEKVLKKIESSEKSDGNANNLRVVKLKK